MLNIYIIQLHYTTQIQNTKLTLLLTLVTYFGNVPTHSQRAMKTAKRRTVNITIRTTFNNQARQHMSTKSLFTVTY